MKLPLLAISAAGGHAEAEQDEGHGRAGGRDLELLAGALRLAAHLREAAEEPQVDAGDRDASAARDERVPELVQDQRGEVAERTGRPRRSRRSSASRRALRGSRCESQ